MEINQQETIISDVFNDWKNGNEQTDDVTILGIQWKMN
jgi:hypothetical protein